MSIDPHEEFAKEVERINSEQPTIGELHAERGREWRKRCQEVIWDAAIFKILNHKTSSHTNADNPGWKLNGEILEFLQ